MDRPHAVCAEAQRRQGRRAVQLPAATFAGSLAVLTWPARPAQFASVPAPATRSLGPRTSRRGQACRSRAMAPSKAVLAGGAAGLGVLVFLLPRLLSKRKSLKEVMIKGALGCRKAPSCRRRKMQAKKLF